mmetsp:Transcript_93835/g.223122  ORF Transcript_93835/g.223122 Transcript_93835/m.223122 type:complete len:83 (+) Transcript_93835:153-401(+)
MCCMRWVCQVWWVRVQSWRACMCWVRRLCWEWVGRVGSVGRVDVRRIRCGVGGMLRQMLALAFVMLLHEAMLSEEISHRDKP